MPDPLPDVMPTLGPETFLTVANARAALAALDSTARQLPNPRLFRHPALRREAQSTSALEGTYEPLRDVLAADEDEPPSTGMREVLNYVTTAERAFAWQADGRPLTVTMLRDLQRVLVRGTAAESASSGAVRDSQVAIGSSPEGITGSRFVPRPPGAELGRRVQELVDWMRVERPDTIAR